MGQWYALSPLLLGYGAPPSMYTGTWLVGWLAVGCWVAWLVVGLVGCWLIGSWTAEFGRLVSWLVGSVVGWLVVG